MIKLQILCILDSIKTCQLQQIKPKLERFDLRPLINWLRLLNILSKIVIMVGQKQGLTTIIAAVTITLILAPMVTDSIFAVKTSSKTGFVHIKGVKVLKFTWCHQK
jgi:hypothetical protein